MGLRKRLDQKKIAGPEIFRAACALSRRDTTALQYLPKPQAAQAVHPHYITRLPSKTLNPTPSTLKP